jgi:hypothetical protein
VIHQSNSKQVWAFQAVPLQSYDDQIRHEMHWYWSRVSSEGEHPTKSASKNSFVPDDAFFQFCEYFINFFNLLKQQQ